MFNLTATLPRMIAYGLLTAALVSALMGLVFGAERWLNRGEMFSVLFSTWGRLGFFRFGAPRRRGFARGLEVPFDAAAVAGRVRADAAGLGGLRRAAVDAGLATASTCG